MGSTHHALEDYGVLLALSGMRVLHSGVWRGCASRYRTHREARGPAYLRLGRDEKPKDFPLPSYAPWRRVLEGPGATLLLVGPWRVVFCAAVMTLPESQRPRTWVLSELPFQPADIPKEFLEDVHASQHVIVVEEHVAQGSVGALLAHALLCMGVPPRRFHHRHALGYPQAITDRRRFTARNARFIPRRFLRC